MKRVLALLGQHSLLRNASFLVLSTAIMSVLGFGFWLFVAHLYSPEQVGIASALISVSTLLSSLSLLGLDAGLLRFLPKAKNQSRVFNAAMLLVAGLAVVSALVYAVVDNLFLGNVAAGFTREGLPLFAVIILVISLNTLTDAMFIANRRAEYHTVVYAVFGLVKLLLPISLVGLGWLGIYTAHALAALVTLVLSLYFMRRVTQYRLRAPADWGFLPAARRYAFHNYVGAQLAGIPAAIMPLIIINQIGAPQAAFFSMAWTMANLLYIVPTSMAQSLLAESAHNPAAQAKHLRHASKLLAIVLVPGVIAAIVIAPYLLRIFGPEYATGSTGIFQILALATFFTAISSVSNAVLNLRQQTAGIVQARIATLAGTLVATFFLIRFGLVGVGWAMLIGFAASSVVYAVIFVRASR